MKRCAWLALAVLALAACGSGSGRLSKGQYEAKLRSAFAAASAGIRSDPASASSTSLLDRIAKSYDGIAAALKGLRVPTNVQRLNDRLAAAASAKAAGLKKLVSRLNGAPPAERQRLLAQYALDLSDFDSAAAALETKGYRFRPNGGT
jgi:hypothetical protein